MLIKRDTRYNATLKRGSEGSVLKCTFTQKYCTKVVLFLKHPFFDTMNRYVLFWTTKTTRMGFVRIYLQLLGSLIIFWGSNVVYTRSPFKNICGFFRILYQLIKVSNFSSFQQLRTNWKKFAGCFNPMNPIVCVYLNLYQI